ncbi:MAG: nucleotidyltransferase domain-containing protein [Sneathiellaceae bacterium]
MSAQPRDLTGADIVRRLRDNRHLLEKYAVRRAALFGSYADGRQTADSDIDLLVEFAVPSYDNFSGLSDDLATLFQRRVDILTPAGLDGIRVASVAESIRSSLLYV